MTFNDFQDSELSTSARIVFNGELPERIVVDYVVYRVRPFEKAPLRCFACRTIIMFHWFVEN